MNAVEIVHKHTILLALNVFAVIVRLKYIDC